MTEPPLWYVCLMLGGAPRPSTEVLAALERFAAERPFLMPGRYAADRAEVRYWEQARSCEEAAELALGVWSEHRASARLPAWEVLGLEVLAQETRYESSLVGRLRVLDLDAPPARLWRPFADAP